jgi:hypothetical protein
MASVVVHDIDHYVCEARVLLAQGFVGFKLLFADFGNQSSALFGFLADHSDDYVLEVPVAH